MEMIGSPSESVPSPSMRKHKKHKRERYDDDALEKPGLKLILKVGGANTPEHNPEFQYTGQFAAEQSELLRSHHKKSKKKKKKKDRSKDKERKHKHHHKDKKRRSEDTQSPSEQDASPPLTIPLLAITPGIVTPVPVPVPAPAPALVPAGAAVAPAPSQHAALVPMEIDDIKEEILGSPKPDMAQLGSPYREPRTCVIKKIQERNTVQRMLEHFLRAIEKKDPQQFFAWPVTDNIAPGYSAIITHPMDCSTMRQKIDDNEYRDLPEFMDDFKLMCSNAMKYNHADTIYYKASKKLLHAGMKLAQADKCAWILSLMPELTKSELGYEVPPEIRAEYKVDVTHLSPLAKRKMPPTKFEAIPDDLEPDEVLASVQKAAREAKAKLQSAPRRGGPNMGFLRQRKDGTTHLNILVGGDGVIPGTKKRPVLLGQLTGKLSEGTGALQGFREDRRNIAKPVKPLYYGAFGSYAPSYDSAFANLSKEESELVYQTYGSDAAVQYAESILDFARDCDYSVYMVDSLLDLMTGGEHTRTKKQLEDRKSLREEEEAVKTVIESASSSLDAVKIDVAELKSLSELGIDVEFLEGMADVVKTTEEQAELQEKLNSMSGLLDKLHKIQHQRLSQNVPAHLSNLPGPSDEEVTLANTITTNLTDIAKKLNPADVVPVTGVRKAMGVVGPEPETSGVPATGTATATAPQEVDLEAELRQYLESENNLVSSPLRADDKTIEEILME